MKRILLAVALTLPAAYSQEHGATPAAGHGEGHGEAGGHGDLALWKWANFAILVAALGWAVSKNAGPFFASRTAEIRKSIDEARKVRDDAVARANEIEKRIGNLSGEVAALRDTSKKEMEAESARIGAETERMIARARESASQEIAAMTKQAQEELRNHAAKLALELAEGKVKARLDGGTQDALVNGFLADLRRTGGSSN